MARQIHELAAWVTANASRFHRVINGAIGVTQKLGRAWGTAARDVSAAATKVTAVIGGLGVFSVRQFAQLERTMASVGAVTQTLGTKLFPQLEAAAMRMGATTEFTADQAAQAMEQLGLAGFQTNEIIAALPGTLQLATAAKLDIATAAGIAAKTMRAFGLEATDLGRINDTLIATFTKSNTDLRQLAEALKPVGPVAKAAGVSLEDTAAILAKMADAGFQGSLGGTSLRNALIRLAAPSAAAKKILAELGVDALDPLFVKLQKIETGFRNAANENEKLLIAAEVFGVRGGPAMLAALEEGTVSIQKFSTELKNAGGIAEKIEKAQLNTLRGQFNILKSAIDGVFISTGKQLNPVFRQLIDELTKFIDANADQMALKLAEAMRGLALFARDAFKAFVGFIPTLEEAGAAVMQFLRPLLNFLREHPRILGALVALKVTGLLGLNKAFASTGVAIAHTVAAIVTSLIPAIAAMGTQVAIATGGISLLVAGLLLFFTKTEAGKKIVAALAKAFAPLVKVLGEIFDKLSSAIGPILSKVVDLFGRLMLIISKPAIKLLAAQLEVVAVALEHALKSLEPLLEGMERFAKLIPTIPGMGGGNKDQKKEEKKQTIEEIKAREAKKRAERIKRDRERAGQQKAAKDKADFERGVERERQRVGAPPGVNPIEWAQNQRGIAERQKREAAKRQRQLQLQREGRAPGTVAAEKQVAAAERDALEQKFPGLGSIQKAVGAGASTVQLSRLFDSMGGNVKGFDSVGAARGILAKTGDQQGQQAAIQAALAAIQRLTAARDAEKKKIEETKRTIETGNEQLNDFQAEFNKLANSSNLALNALQPFDRQIEALRVRLNNGELSSKQFAKALQQLKDATNAAVDAAEKKRQQEIREAILKGDFEKARKLGGLDPKQALEDKIFGFRMNQFNSIIDRQFQSWLGLNGFVDKAAQGFGQLVPQMEKFGHGIDVFAQRFASPEEVGKLNQQLGDFFGSAGGRMTAILNQIALEQQKIPLLDTYRQRRTVMDTIAALRNQLRSLSVAPPPALTGFSTSGGFVDPGLQTPNQPGGGVTVNVAVQEQDGRQLLNKVNRELMRQGHSQFY